MFGIGTIRWSGLQALEDRMNRNPNAMPRDVEALKANEKWLHEIKSRC